MSYVDKNENDFTVSDWLGCILVLFLIFTLIVWPWAVYSITEMYDSFGCEIPLLTYLFLKLKFPSFFGIFALVFFFMQFAGWVKSDLRRRRIWVVCLFIMSLIVMILCVYSLHLPVFNMARVVG